jgi:hypothetical protein
MLANHARFGTSFSVASARSTVWDFVETELDRKPVRVDRNRDR